MLRSIRAKLLGLTLSLVLLVAFSTIATFLTLRVHDSDEAVINLVGRQRTLTQQMTWLALSQPQNSNLASLILQFERNLDSLKDGGTAVNAAGDTVVLSSSTDALIRSQLHAMAQTWATFRGHVERLAALPPDDPDYSAAVRALQVDSLVIVDELDAAVDTLEAQTHTKHLRLKNIQNLFLVVALLILGWGYFITRRHIDLLGRYFS